MCYDLHSEFDIEKHKQTFINYLEVVIFPDGHVEYAVPSHQEKLIEVCQDLLGVSRYELNNRCPKEYYFDFFDLALQCITLRISLGQLHSMF